MISDTHPFSLYHDRLSTELGSDFPMRPTFSNWPICFEAYAKIADDVPSKLCWLESPGKFRTWMQEEIDHLVDLPEVMTTLTEMMDSREHQSTCLGLLGAVSNLVQAYRWGALPMQEEERQREEMTWPVEIWEPYVTLSDHWGLPRRGCIANLFFSNVLEYDDEDDRKPTKLRFRFNDDPQVIRTEENFVIAFTHTESEFRPALPLISEYLELSSRAEQWPDVAEYVLDRRVEILREIQVIFDKTAKSFRSYMGEEQITGKLWSTYVQPIFDWSINGEGGGPSGGETLVFQCLDEFLVVPGDCLMYQDMTKKRSAMPSIYRDLLTSLRFDSDSRFDSFVPSEGDNPIAEARAEIVNKIYMWRLGHARVAKKKLEHSVGTASRAIDSGDARDLTQETEESLPEVVERELVKRARETADAKKLPANGNAACVIS